MSDEGKAVTARRERLGLDIYELANEAGVSRDTVSAIEHGKGFRRASLTKIERALARLETEAGLTAPPRVEEEAIPPIERRRRSTDVQQVVRVRNDLGEVVLEGPREDREQMVADAEALLLALARVARKLDEEEPEADA